jgi:type VI protein secretion system component Hcp
MKRCFLLITLALCLIVPTFASAADQLYMQIPGITGGSLSKPGWIDVFSFSGGAVAPTSSSTAPSKQQSCTMNVQKLVDIAGPRLWVATVTGQTFPTVEIQVTVAATGGAATGERVIYDILLTNAQITSISESAAAGSGIPSESVGFKATNVSLTYTPQNADGSTGTPVTSSFACN